MLPIFVLMIPIFQCFTPAVVNYDSLTITNGGRISMSIDGTSYSIISQSTIQYYKKVNDSYTFINKIGSVCNNNTKLANCIQSRQWMTSDGKRVLYVHNNSVNTLQVAQLVNSTLQFIQNISFPNSLSTNLVCRPSDGSTVQAKQDFLLISDLGYFQMHHFNSTTQLYQKIFFANYTSRKCTYSTDGKYIVCVSVALNIIIYTYNGTNYIATANMQVPNQNGVSTILDAVALQQLNSTAYSLVIIYYFSGTYYMQYFLFTGSVITFVQLVDQPTASYLYLTKNARYMVVSITTYNLLKLYQFDQSTGLFVLTHTFRSLSTLFNLFVSQDASLILFNTFMLNVIDVQATLLFKCDVSNCLSCRILGECATCAATFTLTSNYTCICNSTQTLLSNSCISCNISLCSSCTAINSCSACQKGFILVNNFCVCPKGSTVSQLDGSCVLCSIESYNRCDQNNTCAFSVAQGGMSKAQIIAIALVSLLFVVLAGAIVYLCIKLKTVTDTIPKVGQIQQIEDTKNQETKQQMSTIMVCQGEVPRNLVYSQLTANNNSISLQLVPRQRRRKMRNDEPSQSQILAFQVSHDDQ